ncbi:MAG: YggS family pyridoxal phosphate-dependent enzyme [Candidatus Omnitrophica bacterium]|nr:YggS family pyridoxal phosphate-dependent enzyme [Candidatus Omnitrophota bacterium]
MSVRENISSVLQRISSAALKAGRPPEEVELICVTKEADVHAVREAISCGITDIGENRVQDAISKHTAIGDAVRWHMIGHLQSNKAKPAVEMFHLIHSVDSLRLMEELDKHSVRINKIQEILIQVNVSGERQKSGIDPQGLNELIMAAPGFKHIKVTGLMTIAPLADNQELARPFFRRLKQIADEIRALRIEGVEMRELSMGMTQDFEAAIEEGSTMVRIGRDIFKEGI